VYRERQIKKNDKLIELRQQEIEYVKQHDIDEAEATIKEGEKTRCGTSLDGAEEKS